jgi:UDP-2,3-diacylglucosamine pyrophosphatase LpxH
MKYRSLFLSDCHLGSPNCKAERLYKFLIKHNAKRIYLVGDIIEGYHLGVWPAYHDAVIQVLANRGLSGTEIIFIPGNHDHVFRNHIGCFGSIEIKENAVHETPDGRSWLVAHGDETDTLPHGIWLNLIVIVERLTGFSLWEILRTLFGARIKKHTDAYERKMVHLADGYAGVICGHIHSPKISEVYMNPGDWTHHCTAIAEHEDGRFELLHG